MDRVSLKLVLQEAGLQPGANGSSPKVPIPRR